MIKTHVTNNSYLEAVHSQQDMPHYSQTTEPISQYSGRNTTFTDKKLQALVDSLKFDQLGNRHENIQKAHGRTCKWLLHKQEYRDWLNPDEFSSHHGLLWIKGKPGAGKSTLMKFMLGEVKKKTDNATTISFFFNARGSDIEKSTSGMYRSLLFQLLSLMPSLRHIFRSLDITTQSEHHPQWGIETLKELFQQAVQSLGNAPLLCLVDALDECDEAEIRDMVYFFQDLGRLALSTGVHFHVCFASRHYPHITVGTGIHLTLEGQQGHSQDISNYIETNLHIGNSQAANILRSNLLDKASGVFMWVVLVVKMLNEDHDSGLSSARLRRKLQDIPGDLHDLFHNLLIRDNKMTEEMQLCFQWVLFARQPLSAKELYSAIHSGLVTATSDNEDELFGYQSSEMSLDLVERFLLSASKGLVEVTNTWPQISQFIHESVKDFLLKEKNLRVVWPNIGKGLEGRSHDRLKKCCLDYILIAHYHIAPQLTHNTVNSMALLRFRLTRDEDWPFLHYATMNLLTHADHAQGLGNSQHDFITRFPQQEWVCLQNIVEPNLNHHYGPQTSLLYILSEKNLANLIQIHPSKDRFLCVEAEKHGTPLLAALALRNRETVQGFLEIGTSGLDDSSGEYKHKQVSQERLDVSAHTSSFTYNPSRSVLSQLAELGDDALLSMALCQRSVAIDLGPCQRTGLTLLHQAAERGFVASLRLLIQKGASIDELSLCSSGLTAIQLAALHGHEESVRLLLDQGASVGVCSRATGRNALSWALKGGLKVVQLLLERGAEVNAADYLRRTPLIYAVSCGVVPSIISLLLEKGAMVDLTDYEGKTALHHAVHKNALERGSDGRRTTPLHEATKTSEGDVVKVLLEEGATTDVMDKDGYTPLMRAIHAHKNEVVDLLLAAGAPANVSTKPWDTWSSQSSDSVAREITSPSSDRRATTPPIRTFPLVPLFEAIRLSKYTIVKALLEAGASVDVTDDDGSTPLHQAVRECTMYVVSLLLGRGASTNTVDGDGRTPLELAVHTLSNTSYLHEKEELKIIITSLSAPNDPGVVDAP